MFSAFYPILLLLALPLGMFGSPRTMPELLPVLAALAALVALSVLAWLSRWSSNGAAPLRRAARRHAAREGPRVRVLGPRSARERDHRRSAFARDFAPRSRRRAPKPRAQPRERRISQMRCFELRPGGAPFAQDPASTLSAVSVESPQGAAQAQVTSESPRIFTGVLNIGVSATVDAGPDGDRPRRAACWCERFGQHWCSSLNTLACHGHHRQHTMAAQ